MLYSLYDFRGYKNPFEVIILEEIDPKELFKIEKVSLNYLLLHLQKLIFDLFKQAIINLKTERQRLLNILANVYEQLNHK